MDEEQGRETSPLKRWTRERFKEEVARELGIDLTHTPVSAHDVEKLESTLHADNAGQSEP